MEGKTHVSVVIPHYNNLSKLAVCLDRLNDIDAPAAPEIIVVDNGSSVSLDALRQRHPHVHWEVETSWRSPYPCRNRGINVATGDTVVLLDSNCFPLPDFFSVGIGMLNDGYEVVGGQLKLLHGSDAASRFDLLYSALRPGQEPVTSLPGGVLFVRRQVFTAIGKFLPNVRSLGDIEWTGRAHAAGFQLGITPVSVVEYSTKNFSYFCQKMVRLGRGKKEIYVHTGGHLRQPAWLWRVVKSFLPPNPDFVRRMQRLNIREGTQLNIVQLICFCWLTKVLRGFGMLFGRVERPDRH